MGYNPLRGLAGKVSVPQSKSGSSFYRSRSKKDKELDNYLKLAEKAGLGVDAKKIVDKPRKLSFLQRVGELANTFNPTGAIVRAQRTNEDVFTGYVRDISQRFKAGITGTIPDRQIETGADLAEQFGVTGKLSKPIVGFLADVFLDPTTYIPGGVLLRGAKGALKPVGKLAGGAIKTITPAGFEAGKVAAQGIKDALGNAFSRAYKSSLGLNEEVTDVLGRAGQIERGIARSQAERVAGTTAAERELVGGEAFGVRRAVTQESQNIRKSLVQRWNEATGQKASDITGDTASRLIRETEESAARRTAQIQKSIEYLQKDITKNETSDLQKLIDDLRAEIKESAPKTATKTTTKAAEKVGFSETEQALTSTINLRRRELQETIGALQAKADALKKQSIQASDEAAKIVNKRAKETFSEKVIRLNKEMVRVQDEAVKRQRILQAIQGATDTARVKLDKVPYIFKQNLSPRLLALGRKLQAEGKNVPTALRDLRLEQIQREQLGLARQTGESLVKAGQLQESTLPNVYFPAIAKDAKKVEAAASQARRLGPGAQNYLKQYKAALGPDDVVLDIGQAIGTRRAQVATDLYKGKELKRLVEKYGKKFTSEKAAKEAGYVPINSRGFAGKMGDVIGYVTKEDAQLLGAFTGKAEFETLNALAKATGFDFVTGLFKRSVTAPFVAFHVRNWVSGIVQNFEILGPKALSPSAMGAGSRIATKTLLGKKFAGETIDIAGRQVPLEPIRNAIETRFFGGSFAADLMDAMTKHLADDKVFSLDTLKKTVKTLGVGSEGLLFRAARKQGEFIEMQQKATAVIVAMRQGKTLDEALKLAKQAGFDYRQLTGFESQIMRRIIPFYAFARFNAELQVRTLLNHPERISQIIKAAQNIGEAPTQEERESMPEFLQKTFGIRFGQDKYGNPQFVTSFGTPVEAFADWMDKDPIFRIISNMNPILKTPIEIGIGKDTFRKRDLKDVYTAREFSAAPQIVKDLLKLKPVEKTRFDKGKPTKEKYTIYVADPYRLLIARSLPTSRGVTFLDQAFDGDLNGLAKVLNLVTGIKTVPLDVERYAELKERDTQRELEDLLLRYGVAREFRNVYVPKK